MRLAPIVAGIAVIASTTVFSSPSAHAQGTNTNTQNNQKNQPKEVMVNPGDTLDGIATANQSTYVRLFDANSDIQDPDLIYPGEKIRIPNPDEQLPDRPLPADAPAVPQVSYSAPVKASAPAVSYTSGTNWDKIAA